MVEHVLGVLEVEVLQLEWHVTDLLNQLEVFLVELEFSIKDVMEVKCLYLSCRQWLHSLHLYIECVWLC